MHASVAIVTCRGRQALRLRLADRFLARFCGLMLRRPLGSDEGLFITRCSSVHTCFMRQAIDLVYLSHQGDALRCVARLKPWRASYGPRGAVHVLELAAGAIESFGIAVGDCLQHPYLQRGSSS